MVKRYPEWVDTLRGDLFSLEVRPTNLEPVLKPLNGIKSVFFDVYGTLFISGSGDIEEIADDGTRHHALADLFREYGIKSDPDMLREAFKTEIRTIHKQKKGEGIEYPEVRYEQIWGRLLPVLPEKRRMEFIVKYEMLINPVWPMPHLREILAYLKRGRHHLGLISNAQVFTPLLFDVLLGMSLSDLGFNENLLIFSYAFGRAKPSVSLFHYAAEQAGSYGIKPEAVLYIGNDMLKDIMPAEKAGFHTGLFAGDARSLRLREDDHRCSGISPDIVITDLIQLKTCIEE